MEFISIPAGSFTMGSPNTTYHFEFNSPEAVEAYEMSERKRVKKMTNVNKSEEIRKVAAELSAKGETVRPKTILDILKKRGIKVVSPQVSIVLKIPAGEKQVPVTITRAFELGKTVVTQNPAAFTACSAAVIGATTRPFVARRIATAPARRSFTTAAVFVLFGPSLINF